MRLYKAYANQLITSYLKTKQTKPMYVFVEDDPKKYPQENNVHYINLYDEEPELRRFVERNKHRVANINDKFTVVWEADVGVEGRYRLDYDTYPSQNTDYTNWLQPYKYITENK